MKAPFMIFVLIGILIFLTPFFYGSDHTMNDPIHFLFHGWGIIVIAVAYVYRKKLQ